MPVTATQIREIARGSAVEITLADERRFMIHAPEHVAGSPRGGQIMLPTGGDGLVSLEPGEIAAVRVAGSDPDVESLLRGEIPGWTRDRMSQGPDLFVKVARLDPEELARVLGRVEGKETSGTLERYGNDSRQTGPLLL